MIRTLLTGSQEFDIATQQFKNDSGRPVHTKSLLISHPLEGISLKSFEDHFATGECVRYDDDWYEIKFF